MCEGGSELGNECPVAAGRRQRFDRGEEVALELEEFGEHGQDLLVRLRRTASEGGALGSRPVAGAIGGRQPGALVGGRGAWIEVLGHEVKVVDSEDSAEQ